MNKLRTLTALAVAATSLAAGAASAAPVPTCEIVKDAAGDATVQSDGVDLISADLASDARSVTAVIRVKKLNMNESTAPTGTAFRLQFSVPNRSLPYYLLASNQPTSGQTFEFGSSNGPQLVKIGDATGVFDVAKNEVRITAPVAMDGTAKFVRGTKATDIQAIVQRRFVVLLSGADSSPADAGVSYTAGSRSCVAVGK